MVVYAYNLPNQAKSEHLERVFAPLHVCIKVLPPPILDPSLPSLPSLFATCAARQSARERVPQGPFGTRPSDAHGTCSG